MQVLYLLPPLPANFAVALKIQKARAWPPAEEIARREERESWEYEELSVSDGMPQAKISAFFKPSSPHPPPVAPPPPPLEISVTYTRRHPNPESKRRSSRSLSLSLSLNTNAYHSIVPFSPRDHVFDLRYLISLGLL